MVILSIPSQAYKPRQDRQHQYTLGDLSDTGIAYKELFLKRLQEIPSKILYWYSPLVE